MGVPSSSVLKHSAGSAIRYKFIKIFSLCNYSKFRKVIPKAPHPFSCKIYCGNRSCHTCGNYIGTNVYEAMEDFGNETDERGRNWTWNNA